MKKFSFNFDLLSRELLDSEDYNNDFFEDSNDDDDDEYDDD